MNNLKVGAWAILSIIFIILGLKNTNMKRKAAKQKAVAQRALHEKKTVIFQELIVIKESQIQMTKRSKKDNALELTLLKTEQEKFQRKLDKSKTIICKKDGEIKTIEAAIKASKRLNSKTKRVNKIFFILIFVPAIASAYEIGTGVTGPPVTEDTQTSVGVLVPQKNYIEYINKAINYPKLESVIKTQEDLLGNLKQQIKVLEKDKEYSNVIIDNQDRIIEKQKEYSEYSDKKIKAQIDEIEKLESKTDGLIDTIKKQAFFPVLAALLILLL